MEHLALCVGIDPDPQSKKLGSTGNDRGKFRAGLFGYNDRWYLFFQLAHGLKSVRATEE